MDLLDYYFKKGLDVITIEEKTMNVVCPKDMCTGCMACVEKCPKSAIKIIDNINSYNAVINTSKCIECGMCYKVCQQNFEVTKKQPVNWYQGWSISKTTRDNGASGGMAATFMKTFIHDFGCVYSCVFKNGKFTFECADSMEKIKQFQGSKYVKSSPEGVYSNIKNRLIKGEKILFVGLPCQVAGLKKFVGEKLRENLYTIDLICHGSPSPKLLDKYLREHNIDINDIESILFRTKNDFDAYNGYRKVVSDDIPDRYIEAFLKQLDYTENCYSCKYAGVERVSDITLGDSWGSDLEIEEKKKGISLILCQTSKGEQLISKSNIYLTEVDVKKAIINNKQLQHAAVKNRSRNIFLKYIKKNILFDTAFYLCNPKFFVRQNIKKILLKLKVIKVNNTQEISYGVFIKTNG